LNDPEAIVGNPDTENVVASLYEEPDVGEITVATAFALGAIPIRVAAAINPERTMRVKPCNLAMPSELHTFLDLPIQQQAFHIKGHRHQ
jgi:hypothetical protein